MNIVSWLTFTHWKILLEPFGDRHEAIDSVKIIMVKAIVIEYFSSPANDASNQKVG